MKSKENLKEKVSAAEPEIEKKPMEKNEETGENCAEEVQTALTPEEEEFERRLVEQKDKYIRLYAEYENFRKRSQREREALYTDCKADITGRFLPVLDNLERAVKTPSQDAVYAQGVEMIMRQMTDILTKLGVSEITGDVFDPALHDAVMHIEDENYGAGAITEVFQKGYKIGDKVIRYSTVKVAN